jgi:hypothetical protein
VTSTVVPKLHREQLVQLLKAMSLPGHSDKESEFMLLTFCLNCPDPVGAMNSVLDAPRGATDEDIAREAFGLPARSVETVPATELPMDHPLRYWSIKAE